MKAEFHNNKKNSVFVHCDEERNTVVNRGRAECGTRHDDRNSLTAECYDEGLSTMILRSMAADYGPRARLLYGCLWPLATLDRSHAVGIHFASAALMSSELVSKRIQSSL